jgi:hypothetical protein
MRESYHDVDESERKALVSQVSQEESDQKYSAFSAFLIFLFPACGGLLFGYDIGATSAVIPQLQDEEYSGVKWHQEVEDSAFLQGAITSVELVGAMLGCIVCFKIADDIGRRRSLLLAAALFFCGAIVEYLSGDGTYDATTGIGVLMTGRAVYGFGCGFAMHGAPGTHSLCLCAPAYLSRPTSLPHIPSPTSHPSPRTSHRPHLTYRILFTSHPLTLSPSPAGPQRTSERWPRLLSAAC